MLVFGVLFWRIRAGVGQYWDWSFPYFSDQIHNLFSNKSSSWVSADSGSPLNYASDYFFRFFIGLFIFLPPETLHYLLLVGLFAAGATGMYLLTRPYVGRWLAFLLGLLAWINPAIFYKYTAGHFNYFFSFALFIFLLHFLLHHFRKDFRSSVVLGLFFAFLGVQIQFFIIGGIFIVVYLLFHRDKVALKYLPVVFGLPLLVNLVWLANFITGAASTTQIGATAAKVSFKASSASSFLSIFTFSFSKATLLSRFYAFYELLWNAMLFVFLFWILGRQGTGGKRREKFDLALLVFLAVMMFLATGMYQVVNIYPLSIFYPMLREVGHFAPVIVLAALLLIARAVEQTRWRWALLLVVIGSLFIVGVKFEYFAQPVNFAAARAAFAPFKQVADSDHSQYRILAYPFFDKYEMKGAAATDNTDGLPLQNSGHDSFSAFAKQDFIQNAIAPYQFQDSVQNQLLQTYNIDVLRPWNVKYIFDFSSIYQSDYNLYVPAATYNNDLGLIKNDPHFLDKLMAHNPGRLKRLGAHVLEVTDPLPRLTAQAQLFNADATVRASDASLFTRAQLGRAFDYVSDPSLGAYTTKLTQLFASANSSALDKAKGAFSQSLTTQSPATLYTSQAYRDVSYQATNDTVTLYAQASPPLSLNGQAVAAQSTAKQVVGSAPIAKNTPLYVSFHGSITRIKAGQGGSLGSGKAGESIEILRGVGGNLISNPSFEHNLWEEKVGDCNNYDGSAALGMKRDATQASDGTASLQLRATRHDACTSTDVKLAANTHYLLSFDYQSDGAPTASFFLSAVAGANAPTAAGAPNAATGEPLARGSRAIVDHSWHTATQLVDTGPRAGTAHLFLYALEGDGHAPTVNRYDNVTAVQLESFKQLPLPPAASYAQTTLQPGVQNFAFQDPNYHYTNLIANPSFEKGSWQSKVSDCNAYDSLPKIGMSIDKQDKADGQQSLQLSATRHDACVRATANVHENTDYLFTFSYKTTATNTYGYTTSFDNPGATLNRTQLTSSGPGWHTAQAVVHVPADASTLTIYLYAFESNGRATNIVHYDNVQLTELPDFADRFFVVEQPQHQLAQPAVDTKKAQSESVRTLQVSHASTPFFVSLSETYHPQWRLSTDAGNSWMPKAPATTTGITHTTLSGGINGWLVDPVKLCMASAGGAALRPACTRAADGSYTIRLRAEFVPQRWFAIAAVISWGTVLGAGAYLVLVRRKDAPTYRGRQA